MSGSPEDRHNSGEERISLDSGPMIGRDDPEVSRLASAANSNLPIVETVYGNDENDDESVASVLVDPSQEEVDDLPTPVSSIPDAVPAKASTSPVTVTAALDYIDLGDATIFDPAMDDFFGKIGDPESFRPSIEPPLFPSDNNDLPNESDLLSVPGSEPIPMRTLFLLVLSSRVICISINSPTALLLMFLSLTPSLNHRNKRFSLHKTLLTHAPRLFMHATFKCAS